MISPPSVVLEHPVYVGCVAERHVAGCSASAEHVSVADVVGEAVRTDQWYPTHHEYPSGDAFPRILHDPYRRFGFRAYLFSVGILEDDPSRGASERALDDLLAHRGVIRSIQQLPWSPHAPVAESGHGASVVILQRDPGAFENIASLGERPAVRLLPPAEPSVGGAVAERSVLRTAASAEGVRLRVRYLADCPPEVSFVSVRDLLLQKRDVPRYDVRAAFGDADGHSFPHGGWFALRMEKRCSCRRHERTNENPSGPLSIVSTITLGVFEWKHIP